MMAVGDKVKFPRIGFTGYVERIVPTSDPVIVLRDKHGAELTMRESKIKREVARHDRRLFG
jgi:hypothetical protein